MIDKLIAEGESLVIKNGSMGTYYSGVEFETWAAKTILFFERQFPNSALTKKAIEKNEKLNTNSRSNHEYLIGYLHAAKETMLEEEKAGEEMADFFKDLNS